jgi:hypothetical protein
VAGEGLDEGRFSGARWSRHGNQVGLAGLTMKSVDQRLGFRPAGFDPADGSAEGPRVPGQDPVSELLDRGLHA